MCSGSEVEENLLTDTVSNVRDDNLDHSVDSYGSSDEDCDHKVENDVCSDDDCEEGADQLVYMKHCVENDDGTYSYEMIALWKTMLAEVGWLDDG